jgi:hypothetical protein
MVENLNPTDIEAVKEKLKNGELKVIESNSKSKAKETNSNVKTSQKKQKAESMQKTAVGDQPKKQRALVELNEENFLKALRELGGKNITTSQLWPYFISRETKPQQRFPVMHRFAKKMEKAGKLTITTNPERKRLQYMYTLKERT